MKSKTTLGGINVSVDAIASMTGAIVCECFGVVGMASRKFLKDGWAVLLRQENYSKGVEVKQTKDGLELDIYVIIAYGVKITEVVSEIQKRVKYQVSKTLEIEIAAINVFVQGVKVID
ncbi:MAG: Asp23/Gls24 family envelope stress response protein [Erysipelotrichaceae bacterium]|nr:Asp23/Gls24 family envelope stress response protein [Erysipelotrichaceae bacterium]